MSTDHRAQPKVTFWTKAPADAPDEIKGTTCYFRPEWLEWSVSPRQVYVSAHGPATRVGHRQGVAGWSVEGFLGDERPPWLLLPVDPLAKAILTVDRIADLLNPTEGEN